MPSPFPGMDPFVEAVHRMNLHSSLSAAIRDQLVPKLRPKYVALIAEWTVRGQPDEFSVAIDTRYPDVGVYQRTGDSQASSTAVVSAPSGTLRSVLKALIPHVTVEIRDVRRKRLVSAIEVLSPTNKRGSGRRDYHRRRERLLHGGANLMEIDLLSEGSRIRLEGTIPESRYFVFLTRASRCPFTEFWAMELPDPLPVVPIPLLKDDGDVALDLQAAFGTMYDAAGYDLLVDYSEDPGIPVSDVERRFIEERLKSAGIRR